MAMMAMSSSDLMSEPWLTTPTQVQHHAPPEDIWNKFDIEQDRAIAISNDTLTDHTMNFTNSDMSGYITGSPCGVPMTPMSSTPAPNATHYTMGVPPTPPHSPPTEHDLDDLVEAIPELLEYPSATPPSDFNDILSQLESTPLTDSMETSWGASGPSWWFPLPIPAPEESLKRDIMWGGGTCCPSLMDAPKKERQVSECSTDAVLRDALRTDDMSEDEESEDNMPDTPSGTDSDCDVDDHMSSCTTSSSISSINSNSPRNTNSAARYGIVVNKANNINNSTTTAFVHSVKSEHDYCGRVPETDGIVTPSDTEDEVDVVSCNDQPDAISTFNTGCPTMPTINTPSSSRQHNNQQDQSKISADVKRQLQARIHAMRNRQNRVAVASPEGGEEAPMPNAATPNVAGTTTTGSRFVSVKIKTQGKPAAYTKRMRDYHTEQVMKGTKHRRRNRGESDEGRRNVHNSLERQRRVDLRNAFEYLRQLVPETKNLEKAPKVLILKKAALHCKQLQATEQRALSEIEALKKHNEFLRSKAHCS